MNNLPAELQQRIYEFDDTYKPTMNPQSPWCEIQTHCVVKARELIFKKYKFETAMKICFWEIDDDDVDESECEPSDFESDEEDDFDYTDSCDCCVKGWSKANEFGRCECVCECLKLYRDCQYKCKSESECNCNCDIEEVEEGFVYCPKKSCGKFICLEDCDTGDNYHFICCECNFKFKY